MTLLAVWRWKSWRQIGINWGWNGSRNKTAITQLHLASTILQRQQMECRAKRIYFSRTVGNMKILIALEKPGYNEVHFQLHVCTVWNRWGVSKLILCFVNIFFLLPSHFDSIPNGAFLVYLFKLNLIIELWCEACICLENWAFV